MKPINISICGISSAGKREIMYRIAEINNINKTSIIHEVIEDSIILHLKIKISNVYIQISTLHGSFLFFNQSQSLMPRPDIVVYVIDSQSVRRAAQQQYLKEYLIHAKQHNILWNKISWIWVLNKIDHSTNNSLINIIPSAIHSKIIECSARKNIGIDTLWQKILAALPIAQHD